MLIVIEDEARQIDPAFIKGRELDDVRPGGLGVHIIREVMDVVEYESRDGVGMRLTLFKQLGTQDEPQSAAACEAPEESTGRSEPQQ